MTVFPLAGLFFEVGRFGVFLTRRNPFRVAVSVFLCYTVFSNPVSYAKLPTVIAGLKIRVNGAPTLKGRCAVYILSYKSSTTVLKLFVS